MEKLLFSEEQRYGRWQVWLLLIIVFMSIVIPFSYGIYSQAVLHKPFGTNPMSTEGLIVTGIFSVLILLFIIFIFTKVRLKTRITSMGIYIALLPFYKKWKSISPEEIEKYEINSIPVIRRYGGYGIRFRRKYGRAYILSGNVGLQLYLKNGKKLLIGTQKKQAMLHAMNIMMGNEQ